MTGEILVVLGSVIVSLAISYAWWCKVRVVNLRQSIYDERDRLFDVANQLGAFDDPAYKAVRVHLNDIAACAELVSIPIFALVMARGTTHKPFSDNTPNKQLRDQLDQSLERCAKILGTYLLYQTITGLSLVAVVQLNRLRWVVEKYLLHWCHRWVHSLIPQEMGRAAEGRSC